MSNNKKVEKIQDQVTNRVLAVFGVTAVMIWGLTYLARAFDYSSSYHTANIVARVLLWLGVAGAAGGLIWFGYSVKAGKYKEHSVINGAFLFWFSAALALSTAVMCYYDYTIAMKLIYVMFPVAALLFLVYSVYPREFFTICVSVAILAFLMYIMAKASGSSVMSAYGVYALIAALGVCAACLVLFALCRRRGGRIPVGKGILVFGPKAKSAHIVTLYAAAAILFVASFLLGTPYGFYAIFALCGYLFIAAVYYTVTLM